MDNESYVTIMLSAFLIIMGLVLIVFNDDEPKYRILGYCLGIVFTFVITITSLTGTTAEYKRGQVDAINGTIKYHLVKNPDGTTDWQRITPDSLKAQKLINQE